MEIEPQMEIETQITDSLFTEKVKELMDYSNEQLHVFQFCTDNDAMTNSGEIFEITKSIFNRLIDQLNFVNTSDVDFVFFVVASYTISYKYVMAHDFDNYYNGTYILSMKDLAFRYNINYEDLLQTEIDIMEMLDWKVCSIMN